MVGEVNARVSNLEYIKKKKKLPKILKSIYNTNNVLIIILIKTYL